jgi:hypothetical protein
MLAAIFVCAAAFAQLTPSQLVTWTPSVENLEGDVYRVVFTGKIAQGYHTYTLTDEFSATEIMDAEIQGGELIGDPYELSTPVEETDEFGDPAKHYYDENGNLNIPQKYKTDTGLSLGSWLYTQRRIHEGKTQGYLSEERTGMLEQIGMVWGSGIEHQWNAKYELAKQ